MENSIYIIALRFGKMTKEEIVTQGKFNLNTIRNECSEFRINLHLEFFQKNQEIVFVNLPSLNAEPQMTVITEIINELVTFDKSNKIWLTDEIWKHYRICVENISYNMVPDDGFDNEIDANVAYFNIHNPNDAYKAANLNEVFIDIDFTDSRHFNLIFKCPWEDEHGIWMTINNGKLKDIH